MERNYTRECMAYRLEWTMRSRLFIHFGSDYVPNCYCLVWLPAASAAFRALLCAEELLLFVALWRCLLSDSRHSDATTQPTVHIQIAWISRREQIFDGFIPSDRFSRSQCNFSDIGMDSPASPIMYVGVINRLKKKSYPPEAYFRALCRCVLYWWSFHHCVKRYFSRNHRFRSATGGSGTKRIVALTRIICLNLSFHSCRSSIHSCFLTFSFSCEHKRPLVHRLKSFISILSFPFYAAFAVRHLIIPNTSAAAFDQVQRHIHFNWECVLVCGMRATLRSEMGILNRGINGERQRKLIEWVVRPKHRR